MNLQYELNQFTGTSHWYKYVFNTLLTDGTKFFFETTKSFWYADIIATEGAQLKESFQVWVIEVKDDQATITVEDGNHNHLLTKEIDYTDMPEGKWTIWFINGTMLLPSEY